VRFVGDTAPFTAAELLEPLRAKPGEPYRRSVVLGDVERLETWLVEQGHRTARVDRPSIEPGPAGQRVAVAFPVDVGPRVEVEVLGADMRRLRKRGLLPFLSEEGYDEALVLLAAERIRTWYQEQGHYDVEVDYREELADGVLRVVVEVDPGPRIELEEVDFAGNEEVDDDTLRQLVQTAPAGLLAALPFVDGGSLVDEVLDADVDNVLAYYRLQGYLDAEVGPAEVDRRDGGLHVTIPIVEGRRRTVEEIRFSGLSFLLSMSSVRSSTGWLSKAASRSTVTSRRPSYLPAVLPSSISRSTCPVPCTSSIIRSSEPSTKARSAP
jgi:outer membrane protein assembly factor BamA